MESPKLACVSSTTPNSAFLRGFPAIHFSDFGLCGRSRVSGTILGARLRIQKFRSRRPASAAQRLGYSGLSPSEGRAEAHARSGKAVAAGRGRGERLKLSAPFGRRITEPLDADAAGQATFYCCFDKIGREEGERDGHIDLPNAALLASAKLCDRGHST